MEVELRKYISEAKVVLEDFLAGEIPTCVLILGSGLNFYADTLEQKSFLDYKDLPHMHVSSAEGHVGRFVLGTIPGSKKRILCMQGRVHSYEGVEAWQAAFAVWVCQAVGIKTLFTTIAAGAINPSFKVGNFCAITDHINLTGVNPIVGIEPSYMAQRYVPMLNAYDDKLRASLLSCAKDVGVEVYQGVYAGMLGPSFETPAEIKMLEILGADVVAMSLCEETIVARHMGMKVIGMSLISNMACGVSGGDPTSDEVNEVGYASEDSFAKLMNAFLPTL